MKYFDHDDRRWMEGDHDGKWFALNEDGDRLIMQTGRRSHECFIGTTNLATDSFTGDSCGVVGTAKVALAWMFESDPTIEPCVLDRKRRKPLTVSLADVPQESAVC